MQLVADYLDGQSVRQLAVSWRIHRTTVLDHLERHGVPRRANVRKMTDQQVEEAAQLYGAGNSLIVLGRTYGVDAGTVGRELSQVGVNLRPSGRPRSLRMQT